MEKKELETVGAMSILLDLSAQGKSPEEISEVLNGSMTPSQVAFNIKRITSGRLKYLTPIEQQVILIHDLQRLKKNLEDRLDDKNGDGFAGPLVQTMKLIADRIETINKMVEEKSQIMSQRQAEGIAAALEIIYESVSRRLKKEYPDADTIVIREMIREEIPRAFEIVDKMAEPD